jgi:hypothetical protein
MIARKLDHKKYDTYTSSPSVFHLRSIRGSPTTPRKSHRNPTKTNARTVAFPLFKHAFSSIQKIPFFRLNCSPTPLQQATNRLA